MSDDTQITIAGNLVEDRNSGSPRPELAVSARAVASSGLGAAREAATVAAPLASPSGVGGDTVRFASRMRAIEPTICVE
jgi:hypothetical protein